MPCLMKTWLSCGAICALLLAGCGPAKPKMLAAPVMGYNHTSAAINSFSLNGAGGPNIGPHQGGGKQSCCGLLPEEWHPGLTAEVVWEKDADPYSSSEWPEKRDSEAWHARMREEIKTWTQHRAVVEIPQYGPEFCAIQVHFLPCDQVQVDTTCLTPQHPDYPYKELFQLKEPKKCPTP